jgi:hypothetical protein
LRKIIIIDAVASLNQPVATELVTESNSGKIIAISQGSFDLSNEMLLQQQSFSAKEVRVGHRVVQRPLGEDFRVGQTSSISKRKKFAIKSVKGCTDGLH